MQIINSTNQKLAHKRKGFTLIEMIGVLAVIAILASLLIPKIYEAINNARISNTVLSYNTVKTALADHYAKYGSLASSNGVAFAAIPGPGSTNFDKVLVAEGFLDKPFQVKIGDLGTHIEVVNAASAATAPDGTATPAYDLDGNNAAANDCTGSYVVQAVISNVSLGDAFALSTLLDGATLSAANASVGSDDFRGRVRYAATATTTVYIYVTHR
jgi:prepilin-type N-terminal cleavage/methylation domain-containing protein